MVQYTFQQVNELLTNLGEKVMKVAYEAFTIVDGLQEEIKRGDASNNEDVLHGDVGGEHEPLKGSNSRWTPRP